MLLNDNTKFNIIARASDLQAHLPNGRKLLGEELPQYRKISENLIVVIAGQPDADGYYITEIYVMSAKNEEKTTDEILREFSEKLKQYGL